MGSSNERGKTLSRLLSSGLFLPPIDKNIYRLVNQNSSGKTESGLPIRIQTLHASQS